MGQFFFLNLKNQAMDLLVANSLVDFILGHGSY